MAVSGSNIGLIFKLLADSSQARAEFSTFQSAISGNVSSIVSLFKRVGSESSSSSQAAAQSFKILEGALLNFTAELSEVPKLTRQFTQAISVAAAGNKTLQDTFKSLGVNINQALKSPQQGLAQFLSGFGRLKTETEKVAAAEAVFLTTTGGIVPALDAAAAGMASFTAAEGAATAGAVALDVALLPVTVTIGAIVVAVGAFAVVAGGLFSLAKGAADAGAQIKDLSDKTGVSVRNVSLLTAAAKENGIGFDVVSRSLDQFVTRLDDAARSSGKTEGALAFKKLGVEGKEGLKDVNATLETVIGSLNKTSNAAVRYADTQRVFGLRNDQAAIILKTVGGSLDEYSKKLNTASIVTDAQASASKSFTTSLNRLGAATAGVAINIGRELIPLFQPMIDLTKTVVQLFGDVLITALRAVGPAISNIARGVDVLNAALRASPLFVAVLGAALGDAVLLFSRTATVVGNTAKALAAFATGNFALAAESAGKVATGVTSLFDGIGESTKKALEKAKRATAENLKEILANRKKFSETPRGGNVDLPEKDKTDKSAESAASKTADLLLQIAQRAEKEVALANKRVTEDLKRSFTDRLISLELFTKLSIDAETDLLEAKKATFAREKEVIEAGAKAEEAAISRSVKNRQEAIEKIAVVQLEKTKKLAELDLKSRQAEQDADLKRQGLADDLRRTQLKAEEDHQNRIIAIREVGRKAVEDATRSALQQGTISNEDAEKKLVELERQRFNERESILVAELASKFKNRQDFERINGELIKLDGERVASGQESTRRLIDARAKDLASFRDYGEGIKKLQEQTARAEIAALSTAQLSNADRIRALAEIDKEIVDRELDGIRRRIASQLEANKIDVKDDEATKAAKLENQRRLNEQLAAEEARAKAEKGAISRGATVDVERSDPNSFRSVFGDGPADVLGEAGAALSGFGALVGGFKATFISDLSEIANAVTKPFESIGGALARAATGFAQMTIAAVASGKSIGATMKAMAAAILGQIAQIAVVEALKNLALAFEALGWISLTGNPSAGVAAGHFFAAAALWGGLAGGTAAAAGVISKSGNAASGSSESQGAGAFGGQQRDPEDARFRSGDVTGKLGQDADSQTRGIFGTMFSELRAEIAAQREATDRLAGAASRQAEVGERQAEAAESLVTRINSIPPEDVLSVGVDRAPGLIGRGLEAATAADSDVTRNLALRLGLA